MTQSKCEDIKMTTENFCYWLQGILELGNINKLNESQTKMIKDHLALVFSNKTGMQFPKLDRAKDLDDISKLFNKFVIPKINGDKVMC